MKFLNGPSKLKALSCEFFALNSTFVSVNDCFSDFEYLMNYRRCGYFLIISNEHFENGPDGTEYKDRKEALIDRTRLSRTFESLGFICNTRLNVKAGEMLKAVDECEQVEFRISKSIELRAKHLYAYYIRTG